MADSPDRGANKERAGGSPPEEPRGLKGVIRRTVKAALGPEFESLERRLAEESKQSVRLAERASSVERGLGGLVGRVDEASRLTDARVTQLDEAVRVATLQLEQLSEQAGTVESFSGTLKEVRQAFLDVRSEFEALRDHRFPALEKRLDEVSSGGIGALQREMEALRDARVPGIEKRLDALSGGDISSLQIEVEELRDQRIPRLEASADEAHVAIDALQTELAEIRDVRVSATEGGVGRLHEGLTSVQQSLGEVRDRRLPELAKDLETVQDAQERVQELAEEVRDRRLPALAERVNALVTRLHEELTATAGLVDRILAREPLHVQVDPVSEVELPEAFLAVSAAFMDEFRGGRDEILERVAEYLPLLRTAAPVLDLGCGRGELVAALAGAGVEAAGIDGDPAMVEACRRNGLSVERADLLEFLQKVEPASLGAVTAIHVFEHLEAAVWMTVIDAAARALRSGGRLIVECPNPEALRVGGALFWVDPTHRAPLHPDSLTFVVRAVGLEVEEVRYRRPFPPDQRLATEDQSPDVRHLAERLDEWLSGPRDFAVIARKP